MVWSETEPVIEIAFRLKVKAILPPSDPPGVLYDVVVMPDGRFSRSIVGKIRFPELSIEKPAAVA